MPSVARRRLATPLIALALVLAACGDGGGESVTVADFDKIPPDRLPATVLDLGIGAEEFSATLLAGQEPYIEALGMFGLRKGDLLQATMQVSRFDSPSTIRNPVFRRSLAGQIGGTGQPSVSRVGDETVFIMPSGRQTLAVWYGSEEMYVLTVRPEYSQPRRLLRAMVEATA
ncbi:MAG: hypothetical protein ACT452_16750 [Microthrixaceae bacterium]